jgi:hypothetical protein
MAESLENRYGPVQALAGVAFSVRAGEVFGLLGPNLPADAVDRPRRFCPARVPRGGFRRRRR